MKIKVTYLKPNTLEYRLWNKSKDELIQIIKDQDYVIDHFCK